MYEERIENQSTYEDDKSTSYCESKTIKVTKTNLAIIGRYVIITVRNVAERNVNN